jgi:serine/threonine-protein kinase Chk1
VCSIRKAIPLNAPGPVIAIKFINKDHAFKSGRLRTKQLQLELALHASVCPHDNIIRYIAHGEDPAWVWMALELAEGGDLFDKIEADEGVAEDVAHLYFTQLVSAIGWCHGKGVAHRDIKPENMLLSKNGDLKLADFGLATQYIQQKTGIRKVCGMVCGSPPYIAPEILAVGNANLKRKNGEEKVGYDPQIADIWSCAIVLFVLLVGNTPWDSPVMEESWEYHEYVTTNGRPNDELWDNIPAQAVELVRGMLNIKPTERLSLDAVCKHQWFTRANPHLDKKGKAANPVHLATQMLEKLRIDFDAPIQASQRDRRRQATQGDAMDMSQSSRTSLLGVATTQPPITPINEAGFEWETRSQKPVDMQQRQSTLAPNMSLHDLSQDPSMSQFSSTPGVPFSLTQAARQFNDIMPTHSLAWFPSRLTHAQLLPMLTSALEQLGMPFTPPSAAALEGKEDPVSFRIKVLDANQEPLQGHLVVERSFRHGMEMLDVQFNKAKGDPLRWRRLFKHVAVLCKDAIYFVPGTR